MRILIASSQMPPVPGGAERVAFLQATHLADCGHEVHVLTMTPDPTPHPNVQYHILPSKNIPTLYYATLGSSFIHALLQKHSFDCIHAHMTLPWGFIFRHVSVPLVITLHGCEYRDTRFIYKTLVRETLAKAHAILSPSVWLANYIEKNYGVSPIVLPNGCDLETFYPSNLDKKPGKKKTILFVGRISKEKGIPELLYCARKLPQYDFLFVGNGPLVSLLTLSNIYYLGSQYASDLCALYQSATLCVFPSHKENYPTVALEATSCGKAVIATLIGFSEIIHHGKNGFLVPSKAPHLLCDSIAHLMENNTLRKEFEHYSCLQREAFGMSEHISKLLMLYDALCVRAVRS